MDPTEIRFIRKAFITEWKPFKDFAPPRVGNLEMNSQRGNEIHCAAGKSGTCVGFFNGDEKKYFVLGWLDKPNKPTKNGSISFVLCESPFTSVSIVSRGHRSLVSLQTPLNYQRTNICRRCKWHPGEQILAIVNKKEGKKSLTWDREVTIFWQHYEKSLSL